MATIRGTSKRDVMRDKSANNTLLGFAGNDGLYGNGGNDIVRGGTGNDLLGGGSGNDKLFGEAGVDLMDGGAGNDILDGGLGNDKMKGGTGNDTFIVNSAADVTTDTSGIDLVKSSVTRTLGAGLENLLLTGAGAINGTGNALANILTGNAGNNILKGGAGNDTLNGGGGNDTISFADTTDATVTFVLDASGSGSVTTTSLGTDSYTSIENIEGSATSNDVLTGNGFANVITGLGGTDALNGDSGSDTLYGGDGDDTLDGGDQGDILDGGAGTDTVTYFQSGIGVVASLASPDGNTGMAAGDSYVSIEVLIGSHLTLSGDALTGNAATSTTINGMAGDDILTGGSVADILNGGDDNDMLIGGGGSDTLNGGSGWNRLYGGDGNDIFEAGLGVDAFHGDTDSDTVSYAAGATGSVTVNLATGLGSGDIAATDTYEQVENIIGSQFGDTLTGNADANVIEGGANGDIIDGGDGGDTLDGGTGSNTIDCGFDSFADRVILRLSGVANISNWDFADSDKLVIDSSETGIASLTAGVNFFSFAAAPNNTHGAAGSPILYDDSSTGTLYYDNDGGAGDGPVIIAQGFTGNLLASDFEFIA